MLELRPNCECCDKDLPPEATDAMICTFECTFCADCVETVLKGVCPNCGGNFERRPIRPAEKLIKNPASRKRVLKKYTFSNIIHPKMDIAEFFSEITTKAKISREQMKTASATIAEIAFTATIQNNDSIISFFKSLPASERELFKSAWSKGTFVAKAHLDRKIPEEMKEDSILTQYNKLKKIEKKSAALHNK